MTCMIGVGLERRILASSVELEVREGRKNSISGCLRIRYKKQFSLVEARHSSKYSRAEKAMRSDSEMGL